MSSAIDEPTTQLPEDLAAANRRLEEAWRESSLEITRLDNKVGALEEALAFAKARRKDAEDLASQTRDEFCRTMDELENVEADLEAARVLLVAATDALIEVAPGGASDPRFGTLIWRLSSLIEATAVEA